MKLAKLAFWRETSTAELGGVLSRWMASVSERSLALSSLSLSLSLSHSFPRAAEDAARGGAISPFIGGRHIEST